MVSVSRPFDEVCCMRVSFAYTYKYISIYTYVQFRFKIWNLGVHIKCIILLKLLHLKNSRLSAFTLEKGSHIFFGIPNEYLGSSKLCARAPKETPQLLLTRS